MTDSKHCKHEDFKANVAVGRLSDGDNGPITSYIAEIRIECAQCHLPFQFINLPLGMNLRGATMSVDGQEARLSIAPVGSIPQPLDGVLSFGIRPPGAHMDS